MSNSSEKFLHEDSIPELQGLTFTPEPSSLLQDPIKPLDLDEVASKFPQCINKKDDSQDTPSKVDENAAIVEPKGQIGDENPVVDNVGVLAETSINTMQDTSIKAPEVQPKEGQIVEDSSIDKVPSSGAVDVDANIGDKMALVAVATPRGQDIDYYPNEQDTSNKAPEVEPKQGQVVEDFSIDKVVSSGAVDVDANIGDKMALVAVPTPRGQNIDYYSNEQVQMAGTSNQEQQIEVNNRKRSAYELSERLEGWQIIKRLRNNNKTTDKFYAHIKSDVQFRSLNEVDDFVRFALHPKRPGKKSKTNEENTHLQSPMEGPPRKRHARRTLTWEFVSRNCREDGTIIYDIKLHGVDG